MKQFIVIFIFSIFLFGYEEFKVQKVIDGFYIPWGMTFLDGNTLLIGQRDGKLYKSNIKTKETIEIKHNLPIFKKGQGGLLDLKVSPKYNQDKWIYITYTKNANGGSTALIRAKILNHKLTNIQELLESKSGTKTGYHFGSRITFDTNNHVYFTIGDRGLRHSSQDINNHNGSVIRLNLDGSVPKDNPFVAIEGLDEIYSFGHRNPQGIHYDSIRGLLFLNEHGPRGGDEINIINKGANYGWPIVSKGKEYWNDDMVGVATHKKGIEQAIQYYIPSIAPSSLMVYSGKLFKSWKGDIFSSALKLKHLNKVSYINGKIKNEMRLLIKYKERIRNVIEATNGEIFIATDSGVIYKLTK